ELMPMDKVHGGIDKLAKNLGTEPSHGAGAAAAIMTTDTVPKQTVLHGQGWTVGGMGKGVGMMAPSLATMLVCITTDAQASPAALDAALRKACDVTFNTLDVKGDIAGLAQCCIESGRACLGIGRDRKSTRLNSSHVSISY